MMYRVAVALVEPLYEVNVGQVARVSANFGVKEFILVNPKVDLEGARRFASHGVGLLERVKVCSFDELIERFDYLVGTTAISSRRSSNILRSAITPEMLRDCVKTLKGSVCLIFGRDTTGLTNKELEACDIIVSIPTGTSYPTLNVAHSVAIILYELSQLKAAGGLKIAPRRDRERVIKYAIELANLSRFPSHRIPLLEKAVKKIISKGSPTQREATLLMGLMRKAILVLRRSEDA